MLSSPFPFPVGRKKTAFTLVELLTVIAGIGILAVLIISAMGKARNLAQKEKSRRELQQMALAYLAYSNDRNRNRTMSTQGSKSGQGYL